jgi:fatty acid-binding protein DegV
LHPEVGFSLAVAHTNSPQSGKRVAEKIEERLGKNVALIMNASPAFDVHAGPGAVGILILKTT